MTKFFTWAFAINVALGLIFNLDWVDLVGFGCFIIRFSEYCGEKRS